MAARITYLLGAGASANAIPIVSRFSERLEHFLIKIHKSLENDLSSQELNVHHHLMNKVLPQIKKYRSPDTLARNYSLTNRLSDLDQLKDLLSSFLVFEQLEKSFSDWSATEFDQVEKALIDEIDNTLDSRYISFLATIMRISKDGESRLPNTVNVVSWNYDSQIERAYQEFSSSQAGLFRVQEELACFPRIQSETEYMLPLKQLQKQFNVIKLNGTSAFTAGKDRVELFDFKNHRVNKESYDILRDILFGERCSHQNRLHFAWEDDVKFYGEEIPMIIPPINIESEADRSEFTELQEARYRAIKLFESSQIIVVIGYSFPDFNRLIDKVIFSKFSGKLIIQSPEADKIKQKIRGVNPNIKEIETMTETDSFFIPYEFWE